MSLDRYYGWLTWFQRATGRLGHDSGHAASTVHRRLLEPGGAASGDVLHEQVDEALDATTPAAASAHALTVLDAGCGLGGTVFHLLDRGAASGTGLTLSAVQAAHATAEAVRRGVDDRCRFVVRDYDADLDDLVPDGVDLVVAIESLAHAPDPAATIGRWALRLRPGGRLLIVDDVPTDTLPAGDPAFTAFRRGWHVPQIATNRQLDAAMAAAGLARIHDRDLTRCVPRRGAALVALLIGAMRLAGPIVQLTPAAVLHDALIGGLWLERLYARGQVRYRLIVARRA